MVETQEWIERQREYRREVFGVDYPDGVPPIPELISGSFQTKEAVDLKMRVVFTKLLKNGEEIANNHPKTVERHRNFLSQARGRVLISGLGLGETLFELLKKPDVEHIRIIEIQPEIIEIIGPIVADNDRVEIIQGDIFEYRPADGEVFDFVYHAIWNDKKEVKQAQKKALDAAFSEHAKWHGFVFDPKWGGRRSNAGRKKGVKVGPTKDPDEHRSVRKGVRFTHDEHFLLKKAAAAANVPESVIIQRGVVTEARRVLKEVAAMSDPEIRKVLSQHSKS